MGAAGMLDCGGGAHGAAAAANAITSNRFSYSMNLKVGQACGSHCYWCLLVQKLRVQA